MFTFQRNLISTKSIEESDKIQKEDDSGYLVYEQLMASHLHIALLAKTLMT